MISFIEENYESLKRLCKQYRVKRFEVFGSALTSEGFDPENSDLDFLVEFLPLQPFNRHIDLVMPRAIKNPYFLESINKGREVIYAA